MAFTVSIFMKLSVAQRHQVGIFFTDFR